MHSLRYVSYYETEWSERIGVLSRTTIKTQAYLVARPQDAAANTLRLLYPHRYINFPFLLYIASFLPWAYLCFTEQMTQYHLITMVAVIALELIVLNEFVRPKGYRLRRRRQRFIAKGRLLVVPKTVFKIARQQAKERNLYESGDQLIVLLDEFFGEVSAIVAEYNDRTGASPVKLDKQNRKKIHKIVHLELGRLFDSVVEIREQARRELEYENEVIGEGLDSVIGSLTTTDKPSTDH